MMIYLDRGGTMPAQPTARRKVSAWARDRKMATQTLQEALELVRSGKSENLNYAACRLHGLAAYGELWHTDSGLLGQAYRDIEGWLPGNRAYTTDEWIEAVYECVETQEDCADEYRQRPGITEPEHDPIYDLDW